MAVGLEGPIEFNNKPAYAGPMCGVHPEFSLAQILPDSGNTIETAGGAAAGGEKRDLFRGRIQKTGRGSEGTRRTGSRGRQRANYSHFSDPVEVEKVTQENRESAISR